MFVYPRCGQVFTEHAIIPTLQKHDMEVYLPHIVKHIANLDDIRLVLKFEFTGFSHGVSGIRRLSPVKREADT